MTRRHRILAAIAGAVALLVLPSHTTRAQESNPLAGITTNPTLLRLQLDLGATYAAEAVLMLNEGHDAATLERARTLAMQAYEMLRWAYHGLGKLTTARPRAFANPLFDVVSADVDQARRLNIDARMNLQTSIAYEGERLARVPLAIEQLSHSIRLTRQAADLL